MSNESFLAANRANWDERVAGHWAPDGYDAPSFIADKDRISDVVSFDADYLDVMSKRLVHLQCHFGMDTLSWARLGADVTGVDFSGEAIAAATRLSSESGTMGRFVQCDIYEVPEKLSETFDIVYTGVGAINWLPDIGRWAEVVAGLLEPGGTLYMREGHPVLWSLAWQDPSLEIVYPYFETSDPVPTDDATSYAGSATLKAVRNYEWNHGIGEIVSALIEQGLTIRSLTEHREMEWQGLPSMVQADNGRWVLPEGQRDMVPLMFTLVATSAEA